MTTRSSCGRRLSGQLLRTLEGHQGMVMSVAFDPTGRTLASGSADHTVKMWESDQRSIAAHA